MSACQTTTELFSDYYDGGLSAVERQSLEEHLRGCETCRSEYDRYTRSLQALHDTAPLETTQIFLTNVRAAAQHELERRELYVRTGEPPARPSTPGWVPWAMVVVTALAFGAGYLGSLRPPDRSHEAELARLRRQVEEFIARTPAPVPVPPAPVDEPAVLKKHGLVLEKGEWVPEKMLRDFEAGKVYLGPGKALPEKDAARELAARHLPAPVPVPPAPAPGPTEEQILKDLGLVKVEGVPVPRAWLERWQQGEVLTGVNQWQKPSEIEKAFIEKHRLVNKDGRLMSQREAEEIAARLLVHRPEAATESNAVTAALDGLRIGAPVTSGGLTLYPLIAPKPGPEASFTTLQAALGGGKLAIAERDSLFSVQVRNDLDADVFFLAGQILQGGRCARAVAADAVVPRGKAAAIPVLCVEPGTWKGADAKFAPESGHYVAPPAVRRALAAGQGQGAVWALLARSLDKGKTGVVDVFRKHSKKLLEHGEAYADLADREPGTVGMAVAVGDAVEMAELFQGQALFRAYADRLARGAALEVLEQAPAPAWRPAPAFPNSVRGVKQFLEGVFACAFEAREGGFDLRREDACVGRATVSAAGLLQHAVFFSSGAAEWDRRAAATVPREKIQKALNEYEGRLSNKAAGPLLKSATLREMASINAPEVVAALLLHLREPDLAVRRAVVRELGACGDPAAVKGLLDLLKDSRKEPTIFAEAARALARIGDERAVAEFLKEMDGGEAEIARTVVQAMPELLLQLRNPKPLERAVGRLIELYSASEALARGENVGDAGTRGFRKDEAQALAEAARAALRQVSGLDHDKSSLYQKWWNEPANRAKFIKERTGR